MHVEVMVGMEWQVWETAEPLTNDELATELVRVLEHVWGLQARISHDDTTAAPVLFHPGGEPTYPEVLPGRCTQCAGDVRPILAHGALAYWQCSTCKASYPVIEIPVEKTP